MKQFNRLTSSWRGRRQMLQSFATYYLTVDSSPFHWLLISCISSDVDESVMVLLADEALRICVWVERFCSFCSMVSERVCSLLRELGSVITFRFSAPAAESSFLMFRLLRRNSVNRRLRSNWSIIALACDDEVEIGGKFDGVIYESDSFWLLILRWTELFA